jgi:cobalt-zinc-cadmium efflux system outer membrane protein
MKKVWLLATLLALPTVSIPAQQLVPAGLAAINHAAPSSGQVEASSEPPVLLLDQVIREALEKSPEIQGAYHAASALAHRVPQVKALPDPMVAVGWAGNIAPFSVQQNDPSSYRGVTVSEQFPYPGKLKLRGQMATKESEVADSDLEAVQRRVVADVKTAYYDYFYVGKAIETTKRNKELLEKLSKISEARYRVGKAMQQDVLRSQVEISLLLQKMTMLEQQRTTAQAKINSLMQRAPESPLPPAMDVQQAELRYSLDELYALAATHDTGLMRDSKMIEKGRVGVAIAQREFRPDIGVSYMYQQRDSMADMHGVTVSVNIPIFQKSKQRQGVMEASEQLIGAEKEQASRLNEVRFAIKQQYLAVKASEQLLSLYTKAVVPQSSLALESSMAAYQVGNVDFLSLLANFTTLWSYETDYYRQLADYQTALASIEALTGCDVTERSTVAPEGPNTAVANVNTMSPQEGK